MQIRGERGPDDYEDNEHLRRYNDLLNLLVNRQPANYGISNNGGGNWRAIAIVLGAIVTIDLAIMAWFSSSVIETRQDIAVIKCQLNPSCRIVVTSDKP